MKELNFGLNKFRDFIKSKKCICFGSGAQAKRMICIMQNWNIVKNIVTFVDNDKSKIGKKIKYRGLEFPIVSAEESLGYVDGNTIYIITCSDVIGIKEQMDQYKILKEIPFFSLAELASQQLRISDYDNVVKESDMPLIPKKIHYCWCGSELPDSCKKNIESWEKYCPDYEIIEWNEKNYNFNENKYMRQAALMGKWGLACDYARVDILYNNGGIYLDTDVEVTQCLDELLYQKGFAILDNAFLVNFGTGYGSIAYNPILKELRDYYNDVDYILQDGSLNNEPSPIHIYNVLRKYGLKVNDTFQTVPGINIYPMIMGGSNSYTQQKRVTDKTFFVHYGAATWLDNKYMESKNRLSEYYKCREDGLESY